MLAATAAALVAGFRSFPIALVAGLVVGIAQTEVTRYVEQTGVGTAVPFIVIVIWLVIRGQALPLRDYLLQRLPTIGTGRIHKPGPRLRRRPRRRPALDHAADLDRRDHGARSASR